MYEYVLNGANWIFSNEQSAFYLKCEILFVETIYFDIIFGIDFLLLLFLLAQIQYIPEKCSCTTNAININEILTSLMIPGKKSYNRIYFYEIYIDLIAIAIQ